MKKIYYKVSSFFTEKRSTIILFLLVLFGLFIPKNTYAYSYEMIPGNMDLNSSNFRSIFEARLQEDFIFDDYLYVINGTAGNTNQFLCLFNNDYNYVFNSSNVLQVNSLATPNVYQNITCFRWRIGLWNETNNGYHYIVSSFSGFNTTTGVYSSKTIKNLNGDTIIQKTFDYSPPPKEECPTCEECTECEEGGPVEVSNFPFDKTDFYTLLVLVGILIIMLFLKWCFPMKGGKNNK